MTPRKAAVLLLVLFLGTCNQAIMTAPPGSTFASGSLIANPGFIAAHGDVSVISGLIVEATGDPVADGTVVQFFTNLGKIDEQGKTNDGVVRVNLVSDSRSGTATVQAFSGGAAAGPSFVDGPVVGFSTGSITGGSAVSAAMASASTTVIIGSERPKTVILSADPPRITTGRSTTLLAQVFGESGNPAANVPVIFQILSGSTVTGRLDSGGRAVFTDNDGRATDVLRSNSTVAGSIVVQATTANGIVSNQVSVPVVLP
jgi:hypothetical protein